MGKEGNKVISSEGGRKGREGREGRWGGKRTRKTGSWGWRIGVDFDSLLLSHTLTPSVYSLSSSGTLWIKTCTVWEMLDFPCRAAGRPHPLITSIIRWGPESVWGMPEIPENSAHIHTLTNTAYTTTSKNVLMWKRLRKYPQMYTYGKSVSPVLYTICVKSV